jgi:hypothetical protein
MHIRYITSLVEDLFRRSWFCFGWTMVKALLRITNLWDPTSFGAPRVYRSGVVVVMGK